MNRQTSVQGYLLSIASFCVIIAGMREAKALVVTILLSFFTAIILTPALRWLQVRRVPTVIALLLIIALVGTIGGGVVAVVGQSANQLVQRLPYYQSRLQTEANELEKWIGEQSWSEWLMEAKTNGGEGSNTNPNTNPARSDQPAESSEPTESVPPGKMTAVLDSNDSVAKLLSLEPSDAVDLMKRLLADLGGLFSSALLILITVIFILLEAARFPEKLKAAVGASGGAAGEHVTEIVNNIRRYMFIKTTTSLLTGVLIAGFLLSYDIRYAVLWGLLAFLFNYVPNIGSILAAGPAVALAFVERGTTPAIVTAIGYLVVNSVVSYAIEPRFMGKGLGLSTLVVFLSLIFWGWVLGPIGMLLSAPLTMIVKIVLSDYEETRWIAVMLGAKAPAET